MSDMSHHNGRRLNVTTNLDQALEAISEPKVARSLHVTRTLNEALRKLSGSQAYRIQPEDTVEATIREATSKQDMEGVYRLLHDAYVQQGYVESQNEQQLLYNAEFDNIPETTVLIVEASGLLLGTVSITVDGPSGLPVDKDFGTTCNLIRKRQEILACAWRLVTRYGYADERKLVMTLIGEAVQVALRRKVQICLCALNPKHQHFYSRLLGMKTISMCRSMKSLRNAPGICMRCDTAKLPLWWKRSGSK